MSFSVLIDIAAALAVTALLGEAYGFVRRKFAGSALAPFVLGVVFGFMALAQMYQPLEPFDGLIIDLRNIPIALAGAFLGWRGLLPCLAIAMLTRIGLGGVGMESGLWGMALAGVAGIFWARRRADQDGSTFAGLLFLGLLMSSHLLAALALPRELAIWFVTTAAAPMLLVNLFAVPLIAALLERENYRIRRDNRLAASVTHDPVSGLLLGPAFMREVTNAYAARPFGTYAGYLTITPESGIWSTAVGLFGEPAPIALDRQALSNYLEHSELAGLCSDGRVLVPLSAEEVRKISRIKADLNVALRGTPSAATGTIVTLSMVEASDPADFMRITDTAVVTAHVNWKAERAARKMSGLSSDTPTSARTSRIFNPEEHNMLFAKAEFLIERKDMYAP